MQDDDSLLRSFITIKPAAEKILSDGTDVDGTAKYRRARTESLEYLSELSFQSNRVLDRKPDRVTGYKVLIDLTSLINIHNLICKINKNN
jgi:hypothetical protein